MSPRKPRHLSAEEKALWERVAARTNRTKPAQPDGKHAADIKPPVPAPAKAKPAFKPSPFQVGSRPAKLATKAATSTPALQMDAKRFGTMSRGKLKPEGRIDLHGLTLAAAEPRLMNFILSAQAEGKRLVLVITGKGRDRADGGPIPERVGKLRHQVPIWLARPPLSAAVLQVAQAHIRHGGGGALYVYLRRLR